MIQAMSISFPVDPSLLVSLDALLRTRSVTDAAREQGITQSAMSQRLRKLREALGDPLLVSSGKSLSLTDRAAEIAGPLRAALLDLSAASQLGAAFDPATATRTFQVATSDAGEFFVLPLLTRILDQRAPRVKVIFRAPRLTMLDELEQGSLDLAVGVPETDRAGFRSTRVGEEGFAVLCRPDHPILGPGATLDDYLRCRHVLIAPSGTPGGIADMVLGGMGLGREVSVQISNFLPAPFIVASSDLVLTCPESFAQRATELAPVVLLEAPLPLPLIPVHMLWHERSQHDAGHRWLRETARQVTLDAFPALRVR